MELFTPSCSFVDLVINYPMVRPTVQQGTHRIYADTVLNNPENVAYADEASVALFLYLGDDVYEGHVYCLPGARGARALAFGKLAIDRLFTDRRATKLVVPVALQLPAARWYCRRLGLKPEGMDLFHEYFSLEAVQ